MEDLKKIGEDNIAEIFQYSGDKILKLYKDGMNIHGCENEYNITRYINDCLGIAPRAYEIVRINGKIGAVYEKVQGKNMLHSIMSNPMGLKNEGCKLAKYHLEVHKNVNINIQLVKDKLKQDISKVQELREEEKENIILYLNKLPDDNKLCHFDFQPGNIIIKDKKPVIINWMTACKGDAAADVARTLLILKYGQNKGTSKITKKIFEKFQEKLYEYYKDEYLKLSNCKDVYIERWILPVAAARLSEEIQNDEKEILLDIVKKRLKKL